ncbi:MAG: hypothetical protein KJ574_02180, partial [Nanoarchaeota archaeon]|nr:hypothetical protein [Nanoarchaeota archaeon]
HIVQIFSAEVRARAGTVSPPATEIFLSSGVRLVPTTIYVPDSIISTDSAATNYIRVEDTYGDPRDIGPNTTIEYGFYVRSFVGYGDVFSTESAATADAHSRLEAIVGGYIDLGDIEYENASITQVPSLWGPTLIGVHIWT